MRGFKKAVLAAARRQKIGLADHAGNEATHCFGNRHRRQFSAHQIIIADGNLMRGDIFGHPFIHALVAAADKNDLPEFCQP